MAKSGELAYTAVRGDIVTGARPGGSRLREEELADALGVSRTPVREALRRLQSEGLVEVIPNRGAQVAHWDGAELDDIFALRALIEGYAAGRAAEHITVGELSHLAEVCEEMGRAIAIAAPTGEVASLNLAFHSVIHQAARSRRLVVALDNLIQVSLVHHTFVRYSSDELARSQTHHCELLSALEAHSPDWAEAVMRSHVQAARSSLRRPISEHTVGAPVQEAKR